MGEPDSIQEVLGTSLRDGNMRALDGQCKKTFCLDRSELALLDSLGSEAAGNLHMCHRHVAEYLQYRDTATRNASSNTHWVPKSGRNADAGGVSSGSDSDS